MSNEFEEMFARLVDRKMAPPKIAWMARKGIFTSYELAEAFGDHYMRIYNFEKKGLVKKIRKGKPGWHKDKNNRTLWQWIGDL